MRKLPVLLLLLLATASPALTQSSDNWQSLQQIRPGHLVEVVDMQLAKTWGEFISVTDEAITLRSGRDEKTIRRDDVLRVSSREKSKRLRNTLIGLAIGGAAGLAVGAAMDQGYGEGEHIAKTILTPIGLGAGAGVGSAFPSRETLYRAAQRAKP